jgi:uncharacterized protein
MNEQSGSSSVNMVAFQNNPQTHVVKKTLKGILALLAVSLIAGCAYLEAKQGELIFRPVEGSWRGYNAQAAQGFEEHWIPVGEGEKLHAWYAPAADKNAPVLLYLHGARWNMTGSVTRIPRWNRMGFSVLAIDYRGFGQSSSRAPSEASAYEDAEIAWAYLKTLAPDAKRFIFGHSLGGAIATHLAKKHPEADGLILEGTFTSITDMVKETKWRYLPVGFLITQKFDSLERVKGITVPTFVAHGTSDDIVPFYMGEKLFEAVSARKRFFRAEGGSHHNLTASFFDDYSRGIKEHFGLDGGSGVKAIGTGTPSR